MEGFPENAPQKNMFADATAGWLIENWHLMKNIQNPVESQVRFRDMLKEEIDRRGIDTDVVVPFRREE